MQRDKAGPALAGFLAGAACAAAYAAVVRPRHMRWGATDAERLQPMPGDDVVRRPEYVATRAVTIEAGRDEIWPWIERLADRHGLEAHSLETERWIVLVPSAAPERASWTLALYPQGPERTRLVSRNQARVRETLAAAARVVLMDPAGALALRVWMRRVKRRAEALAAVRHAGLARRHADASSAAAGTLDGSTA